VVAGGLVIVVGYPGFAAPLVVLIALVASLCCAVSIAEFARRLPSAGSLYTHNSCGLGRTGGHLTSWMMLFADGPAAIYRFGIARPRRHRRRCPVGPAPEELQAMGWVFAPANDDQQELDGRQMPVPETVESPAQG
jgi:hypothetical protein